MLRKFLATTASLIGAGALAATLALGGPTLAAAAGPAQGAALAQHPQGGDRTQRGDRLIVVGLVRATVEATGLTNREVVEALKGGQSLAQVAAANGSSGDAVVQALVAKNKQRLDRQVQAGRLSQARADELLRRLTDRATALVNDTTIGSKIEARQG